MSTERPAEGPGIGKQRAEGKGLGPRAGGRYFHEGESVHLIPGVALVPQMPLLEELPSTVLFPPCGFLETQEEQKSHPCILFRAPLLVLLNLHS